LQAQIESGEIEQFTPDMRRATSLSVVPQAQGVAVGLGTAHRENFMRTCRDLHLPALAVMLGGALFFAPRDELVACIVVVLAILGIVALKARSLSARWRERAETVAGDMPAPGTPVRIGADGLTIGSATTPWPSLKLTRVNLRRARRRYYHPPRYWVEQLRLDIAGRPVVLDAAAITHGQEIADTILNRLNPELPSQVVKNRGGG
jgi:hypothetical protein